MKNILFAIILLLSFSVYAQDKTDTTVISSGGEQSDVIQKVPQGYVLTGIKVPAMTAGTTTVYLLVSTDAGTTTDSLYYDGGLYSEAVTTTGTAITFLYNAVFNIDSFKLLFNQTQDADRVIQLIYTK